MSNKFLTGGSGVDVTNGSTNILGRTISAVNLVASSALRTGATGIINTSNLIISDTTGLQTALDAKLNNPATADLDLALFDLKNVTDLEFKTGDSNAITFSPPAVGSAQPYTLPTTFPPGNQILQSTPTGVLSWIPEVGTGDVDSSSIPSVNNRITLFDSTTGTLIKQTGSATITAGIGGDDINVLDKVNCQRLRLNNDAFTNFVEIKADDLLGSNQLYIWPLGSPMVNNSFLTFSSVGNGFFTGMSIDSSDNLDNVESITLNTANNIWSSAGVITVSAGLTSGDIGIGTTNINYNDGARARFKSATLGNFASIQATPLGTTYDIFLPSSLGSINDFLIDADGAGQLQFKSASVLGIDGDVSASINFADDNRLVRSDAVAPSKDVQQSGVTLSDSNVMTGLASIGILSGGNTLTFDTVGLIASYTLSFPEDIGGFPGAHLVFDASGTASFTTVVNLTGSWTATDLLVKTDGIGSKNVAETGVSVDSSDNMSGLNSIDINGSGGSLIQSSQIAVDAIKLNATDTNGGILITSGSSAVLDLNGVNINSSSDITAVNSVSLLETGGGTDAIKFQSPSVIPADYTVEWPDVQPVVGEILQVGGVASEVSLMIWTPIPLPKEYVNGFLVSDISVTTKRIEVGTCQDQDNVFNLILLAATNVVITVTGPGGLQTSSSEAADTWYSINIIGDSTGVNATNVLLIPDGTGFTESGFDKIRRIGWVRNNSGSDFYNYQSASTGRDRQYYWLEDRDLVLNAGAATTQTAVDISEWAPPTCRLVYIEVGHDGDANEFVSITPDSTSYTDDSSPWRILNSSAGFTLHQIWVPCSTSQNIFYENDAVGNDTNIGQIGYVDSI